MFACCCQQEGDVSDKSFSFILLMFACCCQEEGDSVDKGSLPCIMVPKLKIKSFKTTEQTKQRASPELLPMANTLLL